MTSEIAVNLNSQVRMSPVNEVTNKCQTSRHCKTFLFEKEAKDVNKNLFHT